MVTLSGVISHATELGGTVKQGIKQLSGSAGAALIELAMVLPLIVMLILGMVSAGIAFNNQLALTHAAREGWSVRGDTSGDQLRKYERVARRCGYRCCQRLDRLSWSRCSWDTSSALHSSTPMG